MKGDMWIYRMMFKALLIRLCLLVWVGIGLFGAPKEVQSAIHQVEWVAEREVERWDEAMAWSGGVPPRNGDGDEFFVTIRSGNLNTVVAIDKPLEISRLTLHNVLDIQSGGEVLDVAFRESFEWFAGSLFGNHGRFHIYGQGVILSERNKGIGFGTELVVHGELIWKEGDFSVAGTLSIPAEGELIIESSGFLGRPKVIPNGHVDLEGAFRMRSPMGTVLVASSIINSGVVDIESGKLEFDSAVSGSGSYFIGSAGELIFSHITVFAGNSINNEGIIDFSGSIQAASDTYFPGKSIVRGNMGGVGAMRFEDVTIFDSRWDGSGEVIISPSGRFRTEGTQIQLHQDLVNEGHGILGIGFLDFRSKRLWNRSMATLDLLSGVTVDAASLVNEGLMLKRDSEWISRIECPIENSGEVQSSVGVIELLGQPSGGGVWRTEQEGMVIFGVDTIFEGADQWQGNGVIGIMGNVEMSGSFDSNLTFRVSDRLYLTGKIPQSVRSIDLSSGRLTRGGGFPLHVTDLFEWSGGVIDGGSPIVIQELALLDTTNGNLASLRGEVIFEGTTIWNNGAVILDGESSYWLQRGDLECFGNNELRLVRGRFRNEGRIQTSENVSALGLYWDSKYRSLVADSNGLDLNPIPLVGEFLIYGEMELDDSLIVFGPESVGVLSHLEVLDSELRLGQEASLDVKERVHLSRGKIVLEGGSLSLPESLDLNQVVIEGEGLILGELRGENLVIRLNGFAEGLNVEGSLLLHQPDQMVLGVKESGGRMSASSLRVNGLWQLGGAFAMEGLEGDFQMLFPRQPLVIGESSETIQGAFSNAGNGQWLYSDSTGLWYQLFYGAESPFPRNQLVLAQYGSAYDQWRYEYFAPELLGDFETTGPFSDPDGNGNLNFANFLFQGVGRPAFDFGSLPNTVLISVSRTNVFPLPAVGWYGSTDLKEWAPLTFHRAYGTLRSNVTWFRFPGMSGRLFLRGQGQGH